MNSPNARDRQVESRPSRDPGLQPERTALAWNRTGLAGLANAALALRAGIVGDQRLVICLGAVVLLTAVAVMAFGASRKRRLALGVNVVAPSVAMMVATTAFALLACATAFVVLAVTR